LGAENESNIRLKPSTMERGHDFRHPDTAAKTARFLQFLKEAGATGRKTS